MSAISTGRDWHSASIRRPMPRSRPATAKFRSESTIEFCQERAVVVARWGCAGTRGSELSTYPLRWSTAVAVIFLRRQVAGAVSGG